MKRAFPIFAAFALIVLLLAACAPGSASTAGASSASGTATITANKVPVSGGPVSINGAGGTFPLPVYTAWIYNYQKVDPSVTINYQGIGSGGGKKGIIDNTLDFAGSDALLTDQEYTQGKDLQMYPTLAGAVVPIYNIQGISASDPLLIFDRQTLADIYSGAISKWNDPAIAKLNPDLTSKLPDAAITAVHRSDGSGTTEIFTRALSSFSADWKTNVGAGTAVEWPVDKKGTGIGGKGNQGVAAAVQNTPNSIGYVELGYAVANKIAFAKMINKAGNTVTANSDTLASAMNDFSGAFTDKLTAVIVDGPGANSWPISGYTYLILHTQSMTDCTKAQKLLAFWNWALTDPGAAKTAATLGYSVLPGAVRTKVLTRLGEVSCNGQPVVKK